MKNTYLVLAIIGDVIRITCQLQIVTKVTPLNTYPIYLRKILPVEIWLNSNSKLA